MVVVAATKNTQLILVCGVATSPNAFLPFPTTTLPPLLSSPHHLTPTLTPTLPPPPAPPPAPPHRHPIPQTLPLPFLLSHPSKTKKEHILTIPPAQAEKAAKASAKAAQNATARSSATTSKASPSPPSVVSRAVAASSVFLLVSVSSPHPILRVYLLPLLHHSLSWFATS